MFIKLTDKPPIITLVDLYTSNGVLPEGSRAIIVGIDKTLNLTIEYATNTKISNVFQHQVKVL